MAGDSAPNVLDVVLSRAWLTDALGSDGNSGKATEVTVVEHLQTVATKVRFEVVFEEDSGERATRNYCVKGYFTGDASSSGAGRPEALFYEEMAGTLGINVPRCPYVGIDASTSHARHRRRRPRRVRARRREVDNSDVASIERRDEDRSRLTRRNG